MSETAAEPLAATGPSLGEPARSKLDQILGVVPRALASHAHIIWLLGLGIYLIVLPLLGVHVSSSAELIGGNYTNVTSDLGACIAAGGTLKLVQQQRKRNRAAEAAELAAAAAHRIMADLYKHHTGMEHQDAPKPSN